VFTVPSNLVPGVGGGGLAYAVRLDDHGLNVGPRQFSPPDFEHYALYLLDPARSTGGVQQYHGLTRENIGRSQCLQTSNWL